MDITKIVSAINTNTTGAWVGYDIDGHQFIIVGFRKDNVDDTFAQKFRVATRLKMSYSIVGMTTNEAIEFIQSLIEKEENELREQEEKAAAKFEAELKDGTLYKY